MMLTTQTACPCRDLPFETSPDLRHGHNCHDSHFHSGFSVTFSLFLVNRLPGTTDHHPRWLSLAEAKLLRPPSTPSMATIIAGDIGILGGNFSTFRPFPCQSLIRHHQSPQLAASPRCPLSIATCSTPRRSVIGIFQRRTSAALSVPDRTVASA